jgi:hypothetical protein
MVCTLYGTEVYYLIPMLIPAISTIANLPRPAVSPWVPSLYFNQFLKFYCKRMTGEFCPSSVFEVLLQTYDW